MLALRCQGSPRAVLATRGVLEASQDATWAAAHPPDRFGIRAAAPSRARAAAGRRGSGHTGTAAARRITPVGSANVRSPARVPSR